jgi:hypothetical protein
LSNTAEKVLWTFAALFMLVASAPCAPGPVLDVADLVAKSDLVPIGQVISIEEKLPASNDATRDDQDTHIMTATMRVDQWLKGISTSSQITFEFAFPGSTGISPRSYRMVFLKKQPTGFTFASGYYPSLPAVPEIALRHVTAVENVIEQLQAVTQNRNGSIEEKQQALFALQTLRLPDATAALKIALQDKTPDLRLIAAAALLERNDVSAMPIAESALIDRPRGVPSYFFHNIAYAISQGVSDEHAVSALVRLMQVPDLETRRASASALWHTHSRSAIPGLIQALNDEDFEVRYYGVVGLAEVTGESDWHPNMEVFRSDEARYLQHWHDWASRQ